MELVETAIGNTERALEAHIRAFLGEQVEGARKKVQDYCDRWARGRRRGPAEEGGLGGGMGGGMRRHGKGNGAAARELRSFCARLFRLQGHGLVRCWAQLASLPAGAPVAVLCNSWPAERAKWLVVPQLTCTSITEVV